MAKAEEVRIGRPNRERLEYALWQFYCSVYCDQQEKWGQSREKAAEDYRSIDPPPPAPWLDATRTEGHHDT